MHIIEVKTKVKNVNAYNKSSFLTNKLDKSVTKVVCKWDKVVGRKYRQ